MANKLPDDFAVYILTHGRPNNVVTHATLRRLGYTGKIIVFIDDLDKTRDEYIKNFGDEVVIFDKKAIAKTFDIGDNFTEMNTVTYARNAVFESAKELGIKYFVQFDDDYRSFRFKYDKELEYIISGPRIERSLDHIFACLLNFYKSTQISSIAISQGGDFIGGTNSSFAQNIFLKRKCMNSFFCSTDRPFKFMSRMNDDVTTYVVNGKTGNIYFTTNQICLQQGATQKNPGGLTEMYLSLGTYVKSFYTVMFNPSSVKVKMLNTSNARLHHNINWKNTVPLILSEDLKKKAVTHA